MGPGQSEFIPWHRRAGPPIYPYSHRGRTTHWFIKSITQWLVRPFIHSPIHPLSDSFILPMTQWLIHSHAESPIRSVTYSFAQWLAQPFAQSPNESFIRPATASTTLGLILSLGDSLILSMAHSSARRLNHPTRWLIQSHSDWFVHTKYYNAKQHNTYSKVSSTRNNTLHYITK